MSHLNSAMDTERPQKLREVSLREAFFVWLRVALLSFGGPAAQIAVMHRIIVEEKRWLNERRFLSSLNFCMLLPGPEAQQLATYIGWLMHGVRGGLMAGLLFILPGFISILLLSFLYVLLQDSTAVQSLFFGLKCAVLAVVAEAVVRVAKRVLHHRVLLAISIFAFLLLWTRLLPFPAVIGLAAVAGLAGHSLAPSVFAGQRSPDAEKESSRLTLTTTPPTIRRSLTVTIVCLALWVLPVIVVSKHFGRESVYAESSVFFSKAAVVTFGGAYAVLSYVDQQAVDQFHWLKKGEMLDGLGLAETTPGPLIMVVQFVGFIAAWRRGQGLPPLWAGTLGAILTIWVTFVPCFLWIFLGAPYMERLMEKKWLASALTAISAAVVGVIATLGVNMLLATLFSLTSTASIAGISLAYPVLSSLRLDALAVATLGFTVLLVLRRGLAVTLLTCVVAGLLIRLAH